VSLTVPNYTYPYRQGTNRSHSSCSRVRASWWRGEQNYFDKFNSKNDSRYASGVGWIILQKRLSPHFQGIQRQG